MKELDELKGLIKQNCKVLAERYGLSVVGIFGSYARGEQSAQSDLALLVEPLRPISLPELVGAEIYLGETLGVKVDLVLKRALREDLRKSILDEMVAA